MKLSVFESTEGIFDAAAQYIAAQLTPSSTIGVATGKTPLGLYQAIAKEGCVRPKAGFALDEYSGVGPEHAGSFAHYVRAHIEPAFQMPMGTIRVPNGMAANLDAEAEQFESEISASTIDVQILGVGSNGHIAFNEPGSQKDSLTRVVELAESTKEANRDDFPGEIPSRAITQGVATILRARSLCLLVTGSSKARALSALLGEVEQSSWPVSFLASHPDLRVFTDRLTLELAENSPAD